MGRPKGVKSKTNRVWSKEDKMRAIHSVMTGQTQNTVARSLKISTGMLCNWIRIYQEEGEEALGRRQGNHHSDKVGDILPYYKCLNDLIKILKMEEQSSPIVLHTDQGTVYSSRAYFEAHKKYNITRSMSRIGTPTDNPVIEATNGWIKQEMLIDFGLNKSDNFKEFIDSYMHYYNNVRPAYALGYKTPIQFKTEQGF